MSEPMMHGSSDDWNKMNPQFRTRLLSELTRLKAENERLRKAGDAMLALWEDTQSGHWAIDDAKPAWNAAKEGKPSV